LVLNLLWRICGAHRTAQQKCALDNAFALILLREPLFHTCIAVDGVPTFGQPMSK
jgi:hypothetical protein